MASVKQVIVIRKDLNMRKGKMVAQGAHASLKTFTDLFRLTEEGKAELSLTPEMVEWLMTDYRKICVGVNSEEELLALHNQAKDAGLPTSLVRDHGLTEFGGVPTHTAVSIGPARAEDVDKITGHLSLL